MRHWDCREQLLCVSICVGLSACAQRAKPPEVPGAADLEAEAKTDERDAARHQAQYDPAAAKTLVDQSWSSCPEDKTCWSDRTNPTEVHRLRAERLRERAERLREEAEALRRVEEDKCAPYDQADREASPFTHADDIREIDPVWRTERRGTADLTELAGARVVFSAAPGITASWLQGLVDCHMARAAVDGFDADASTRSPLRVPSATAEVEREHDAFSLRVEAADEKAAREVWRRMSELKPAVAKSAQR